MDSFLLVLITTEHLFQMKKKQFVKNLESLILYFSSNDCHQIVHSTEYKSTLRRNNAIVKYKDNFGEVKTFVKVIANEETHVLALIHPMERSTVTIPNCQRAANNHAIPLRPPSGRYIVAVPVKDICDVCVCVLLSNELCFVSATPNRIEKE